MSESRSRFQVVASTTTIDRAKQVAWERGLTLTEFVLGAIAKEDDEKLKKLVEKDLGGRKKTGARPPKPED